jgi:hypothetical protein
LKKKDALKDVLFPRFTEEEIEAARTPKGGFSYASFKKLGVPYPPPKGWRKAITIRTHKPVAEPVRPVKKEDTPERWESVLALARFWFRKKK